jgi:hypothetical protein
VKPLRGKLVELKLDLMVDAFWFMLSCESFGSAFIVDHSCNVYVCQLVVFLKSSPRSAIFRQSTVMRKVRFSALVVGSCYRPWRGADVLLGMATQVPFFGCAHDRLLLCHMGETLSMSLSFCVHECSSALSSVYCVNNLWCYVGHLPDPS